MNTKYKRHEKVKLLIDPLEEDLEYYTNPPEKIKAGMFGKINVILPNGKYHVEVIENKKTIAYAVMDEDQIELIDSRVPDEHEEKVEDWADEVKD